MRRELACGVLAMAAVCGRAAVDLNGNQQSDLWESWYAATNLPAAADADGDGVSNRDESIAGTDPWNPLSLPAITLPPTGGPPAAAWAAQAGKTYFLEAAAEAGAPWVVITNVPGSNTLLLAALDFSVLTHRVFRVRVGDVFSDGSGLSDWEKLAAGLIRSNAWSNGQFDPQGHALDDYAYVTNQLAGQNVLTIVADDLTGAQPEVGQAVQDPCSFTILRGGFPFRSITGALAVSGTAVAGLDYQPLPAQVEFPAGVLSTTFIVTPLAHTDLTTTATATLSLQPGPGYTVGQPAAASVLIQPSDAPKGTGLTGAYYDHTNSSSYSSGAASFTNANVTLVATRLDPAINFTWNTTNLPDPSILSNITYLVRWTGQVQPQYSEPYFFNTYMADGVRVWVDGKLLVDQWANQSAADRPSVPVDLVAGVRYDLRVEFYQSAGTAWAQLSWYSPSQPKQIIPTARLYPASVPAAAPAVVSAHTAYALLGYPFTNVVTANNGAGLVSVGPLPPGLVFTASNRLIHGVPTQAGRFQIAIAATNAAGGVQSVLDLTVIDTGAVITREVWTNVPGDAVADIPLDTPASFTGQLATLEAPADFGDDYAQRWRGYLTAPLTGNYYFWIAAGDAAELWLSNDAEHVNKVRRCRVDPPGSGPRAWTNQPAQRSAWLALEAGQRYYLEVLHKAGSNTADHLAVGWVRPDQAAALPDDVVPGQVLSPFIPQVAFASSGTLFTATLLAQGGVVSYGQGTATLRLSADESRATLRLSYTNLLSAVTGVHLHAESYQTNFNQQLYSITESSPQADGSYEWTLAGVGTLGVADVVEVLKQGKAYLDLHTTNYPLGELRGNFTLAVGAPSFVPPPPPPAWADDHTTTNGAVRFLNQTTFGPHPDDVASVRALGYAAWLDDQFARPPTYHLPTVLSNKTSSPNNFFTGTQMFNSWWEKAITAPDQLRQRVAFALSQILVISDVGTLNGNARAESHFYDTLLNGAFGNFRQLLEDVTLTPGMGLYLDMRGNAKGSIITGTHPNENYAREILQLFSIGLYRLWPDGTLVMNSKGDLVPTYDQQEILGYAAVFTGWNYWQPVQTNGRLPTNWSPSSNYTNFMVQVPSRHDQAAKRILDRVVLPAAAGPETNSADVAYDTYALNDLELALDAIFHHANTGPFLCRQLIQRLVTSHPSRDYVHRVVQVFNDNGAGVRGDLQAVLQAILLDREARDPALLNTPTFGKQREPVLRVAALGRAFPAPPALAGTYAQTGTATLAITFPTAHRFATGDRANFVFTNGTPIPSPDRYTITVTATNQLALSDPTLLQATFVQSNGLINVAFVNHYLLASNYCYLVFTNATLTSGVYQVGSAVNNNVYFPTADTNLLRGTVLIPRRNGGFTVSGYAVGSTTNVIRFYCDQHHQLDPGTPVQAVFHAGVATDGVYVVSSIVDLKSFIVPTGGQNNDSDSPVYLYPLVPPPLLRSGGVVMSYSTFRMDNTDTTLTQTPMNAPTVFNYFFPDYKYPGALAAAGLTTPEFQLTSDSGVANLNNFLAGGLLNSQSTNTGGFSSFKDGGEALTLDLGPWTSTNYASNTGIPLLFDEFNARLCAGQLGPGVKTAVVAYVASTNVPYSSPTPTAAQIRDRVRATLHQIVTSPGYAIQK